MSISSTLDRLHSRATQNNWLWLFSLFCRFALALGFIPAAIVKLNDERFASGLHTNHPMGAYLEALHHTGYYYTFIGVVQLAAAIFLLFPRTVTLGAFLYFPVILNITVLTYAVRFDGSLFTAPLMTLANLYILGWNYEKWKYILPFNRAPGSAAPVDERRLPRSRAALKRLFSDKFPTLFSVGCLAAIVICVVGIPSLYSVKPRNTLPHCLRQFKETDRTAAGEAFCHCIHTSGEPLAKCLTAFDDAPDDTAPKP
jgi:hypothetical protein